MSNTIFLTNPSHIDIIYYVYFINKCILETLDTNQQPINSDIVSQQANFIQKQNKVAEIKYKIFAFVLLILCIWFWGWLESKIAEVDALHTNISDIKNTNQLLDIKIKSDQTNKKIIWLAKEQYDLIVNCINKRICSGITTNKEISSNLDNLRTFYLTNKLEGTKMSIDQKLVLKAIDDYLLKKDGNSIGQIQSITYGEQVTVNEEKGIFKLPINVQIEFFNKDEFVNYILNTEKYLDPALKYRVFFRIVSMNYNIANYESLQKVTMLMEVYYYR